MFPRQRLIVSAVGALTLCIAGCTSDRAPSSKAAPLRWGGPANISMLPIIAERKGFFREEGIETKPNYLQTGKMAMDAVVSGDIDLGVLVETNIAFIKFQNATPIKVVACVMQKHDDALIVRTDKGIHKPTDLYGKSISIVPATTSHRFADLFVDFYKLDRRRIQFANSTPPGIQAGIANGSMPAGSIWEPFRYNLEQMLGDKVTQFRDPRIYTAYALISARASVVQRDRPRIIKFLRALIKARDFIQNNRQEAIGILAQEIGMDKKVLAAIWSEYDLTLGLDPGLEKVFEDTGAWAKQTQPSFQSISVPSYADVLDPSLLREAQIANATSSSSTARP